MLQSTSVLAAGILIECCLMVFITFDDPFRNKVKVIQFYFPASGGKPNHALSLLLAVSFLPGEVVSHVPNFAASMAN